MADEKTPDTKATEAEGQSFHNEALTGSGTINPDGTYGPPQPDPTLVRGLGARKTSGGREVPDPNVVVGANVVPASAVHTEGEPEPEGDGDKASQSTPAKATAPVKSTPRTSVSGNGGDNK